MKDALLGLLVSALTGLLLFGGCDLLENGKEEKAKADSTYFRATLNGGEVWTAEGTNAANRLYSANGFEWLSIRVANYPGSTGRYAYRESLDFRVVFRGTGTYPLVEDTPEGAYEETGVVYREGEGDVTFTRYHPTVDSAKNRITITSYDSATRIMEGTFRTTLVVDSSDRESEPGEPDRRRPDTLRFTDGTFRVKVEDQR